MKVLFVNTTDQNGGAARAMYRLHRALLRANVDSHILVQRKLSQDKKVLGPENAFQKAFSRVRPFLDNLPLRRYKERKHTPFSPSWVPFSGLYKKINSLSPDIVHLHWICGGMVPLEDLAKIKAPIIWSLHDMWAFTGGCHYDHECGKYKTLCGNCYVLGSEQNHDLSKKIFLRKQKNFQRCANITINGLSRWVASCAKESALFKDYTVVNLPNPIDTEVFKPVDKRLSRKLLNLSQDKKIVLFGAMNATGDLRKGFNELVQAIQALKTGNVELVVFGSEKPESPHNFGFDPIYLGHLFDDLSLRITYNAADVMVVPSRQENLSNAIMESLACGTPVVGFDIGGNSDMIEHKRNGYLATPFKPLDLAAGIDWVLTNPNYESLRRNAREKVIREFESSLVAKKYIRLYNQILSGKVKTNI